VTVWAELGCLQPAVGHSACEANDSLLQSGVHCRGAVVYAELAVDVDQVRLHGRFADVQGACQLFIAQAFSEEIQDLYLALTEGLLPRSSDVAHQPLCNHRREQRSAHCRCPDGFVEFLPRRVLEQVSRRPGFDGSMSASES
jgi:hypothetical protein